MSSVELDYAALTLDSSIFIGNGVNLERGILKQLEQFANSPVKLVISEIVYREIRSHLLERVHDSRTKLLGAMKSVKAQFGVSDEAAEASTLDLLGTRSDQEIVDIRLTSFLARTGAEIVEASSADMKALIDLYFEVEPPFESGRDKKAEFPDAIALLSLQSWAQERDVHVLAVSEDNGWTNFSNSSKFLDSMQDLAKALAHFQPHNAAKNIIESLRQLIERKGKHEILDHLTEMIIETTNEAEVDVEYHSAIHAEIDQVEVRYREHEYVCDDHGRAVVDLVRIEENWLVLRLRIQITYDVDAWFSMSVWDSTDKEYVSIGSAKAASSGSIETDILVSLTADFSKGIEQVKVGELALDLSLPVAEIGEVEPNLRDD